MGLVDVSSCLLFGGGEGQTSSTKPELVDWQNCQVDCQLDTSQVSFNCFARQSGKRTWSPWELDPPCRKKACFAHRSERCSFPLPSPREPHPLGWDHRLHGRRIPEECAESEKAAPKPITSLDPGPDICLGSSFRMKQGKSFHCRGELNILMLSQCNILSSHVLKFDSDLSILCMPTTLRT